MQLIIMLAKDKGMSMGENLNGMMHLMVGLGHRIDGAPNVNIFVGNSAKIREFRALAQSLLTADGQAIYSDFPNTMTGGNTDECLAKGQNTPEADMKYLAAYYVAEEITPELQTFLNTCDQFANYEPMNAISDTARILPARDDYSTETTGKKILLVINSKEALQTKLNACALAGLEVGRLADFQALHLLKVPDANGGLHENISRHPFPIVTASTNQNGFQENSDKAKANDGLTVSTVADSATVVFGDTLDVEAIFNRENTALIRAGFPNIAQKNQKQSEKSMFRKKAEASTSAAASSSLRTEETSGMNP